LSFNQEQMWLLSSLAGASAYNMPVAYELDQVPDVPALRAALDAVAARHEVLRTRFQRLEDGGVCGIVVPVESFQVPVEVIEVGGAEEELAAVTAEASAPFNLEAEPLVRVRVLVRLSPRSGAVLAVTMHHAVGDAWSQDVFWRELTEAYEASLQGSTPAWAALPIQYADYAAWQREQLDGDSGEALRSFWKDALAGVPSMLQLPQDRARPAQPTFAAGAIRSTLPDGLLGRLEEVARALRVNLQAVLLAGLQAVLLRYSGQDDVVVGVPVAGRDRSETHGLIGYFINTLPVRCLASEDATFADMIRDASKATLAALDHSLLPLEDVVAVSGVARVPNANPLFQVLLQYTPEEGELVPRLGSIGCNDFQQTASLAHAKMDISFIINGPSIFVEYMAEIFDGETVERISVSLISTLSQFVERIDSRWMGGSLLSLHDQVEVVSYSMGAERPEFLAAPLAHDAFGAVATKYPERRCLCFQDEWLTYGEVSALVSSVAGHLAALGIGPGITVGIMLDRSFDLVVCILGALKAGGCYLPCDPSYPDDRLAIYLEDGRAKVVLVQAWNMLRAQAMVEPGVPIIDVATFSAKPTSEFSSRVDLLPARPDDPAYILFTSGSTGRPKGVMVAHRGLKDVLPWLVEMYSLSKCSI